MQVTRDLGSWGWVLGFEDGTVVYHSGDTDLFGDMNLVRERLAPSIAVLPIGGHYTMGPRDAARAVDMLGVGTVIPVHYGTFPILSGTPDELRSHTSAEVVSLEPGETWEVRPAAPRSAVAQVADVERPRGMPNSSSIVEASATFGRPASGSGRG